jgi:hypothetical protein
MDVELTPDQPAAVVQAVELLLDAGPPEPDPWWQAGIEEALSEDA